MPPQLWQRLGQAIRERREDHLRISQADLAHEAGVTERLIRNLERAEKDSYRGATLRSVERALGWETGSVDQVLAGGDPTLPASERGRSGSPVPASLEELQARAEELMATAEELKREIARIRGNDPADAQRRN